MLLSVLFFCIGLILLIKGGDWFVDGAVGIAHRFKLSELLIGATIVSIGTTLPEVMVSSQAAFQANAGISYGNAIGSVICNTSLIAALTVAIKPQTIDRKTLILPVGAFFSASVIYIIFAYANGKFERWNGILFLLLFVLYILASVRQMQKYPELDDSSEFSQSDENESIVKEILLLVIGAAAIALGADLLVDHGTEIAVYLGVPSSVIGLTIIALGTSLPELITAITSLIKGHSSLSLGNIIGANLFNIILVSGAAITISPFAVPSEKMLGTINSSFIIDIPVMMVVMSVLCVPALIKQKLSRWQGIVLLLIYCSFTVYQFVS